MLKRRDFIQSAFAASSLSLTGVPAIALESSQDSVLPAATWFVADTRHPEADAVSQEFLRAGSVVLTTDGDVTDLWSNTFARAWRENPAVVAGVSGEDVLFVLETLARDHGMTLVHSAHLPEELPLSGGDPLSFRSWILAPKIRHA